ITASLVLLCFLISCAPKPAELLVSDAWIRTASIQAGIQHTEEKMGSAPMTDDWRDNQSTSAIYFSLHNNTAQADRLLSVECEVAEIVEIHTTQMNHDIMRMRAVENLEIPAGETVEFKPGGYHIMLIGLKKDLIAGDEIPFVLVFQTMGRMRFTAEVKTP
ncbi:MAG: copper chaperone PCu(A)C, partial [Chloroflexota bacterium]